MCILYLLLTLLIDMQISKKSVICVLIFTAQNTCRIFKVNNDWIHFSKSNNIIQVDPLPKSESTESLKLQTDTQVGSLRVIETYVTFLRNFLFSLVRKEVIYQSILNILSRL